MTTDLLLPSAVGQIHLGVHHVMHSPYRRLHLVETQHTHWALSFVEAGRVTSICREEKFQVLPGDIMVHPPRMPYSEIADVPGLHKWILFEAQMVPNVDLFRVHPVCPVVRLPDPTEFSQTFDTLLTVWENPDTPFRDLRLFALTAEILQRVLTGWSAMGSPPRPASMMTTEDRFTQVITFMTDHLSEKLTRNDLAERLYLHPVYFDRIFRATYDVPPMTMLRKMRLDRARHLLESTDDTLSAIADRCGFATSAHLSRHFQVRFGQSPGEYRESFRCATQGYGRFE